MQRPSTNRLVRSRSPRAAARPGFTLLETSMALVIIGVGVLAFVDAQNTFIKNNAWSSQAATATLLANEIRELTRRLPRHDPVTGLWLDSSGGGQPVVRGWGRDAGEVLVTDFDDVDDFDGLTFGSGAGNVSGPINSFGEVIPQTDADGHTVLDGDRPVPLRGWTQSVTVEKVDPFNYTLVRAAAFNEPASGNFAGRRVDQYPLRVTVVVSYRPDAETHAEEVTRMVWVVP